MQTLPQRPHVNMFHLLLRGTPEELTQKALRASKATQVWGFVHFQNAQIPGHSKLEWYIGDAALDTPTEKIVEYIKHLLDQNPS